MHRKVIKLNKPIYIGTTVLDLSKMYMSEFYHCKLKPFYGDRVRLMYTDTDSLVLKIQTDDVFQDLQHPDLNSEFDFHKSKRNHNDVPYMTVGKMKLECGPDQHLAEWVGVANKVYAIKLAEFDQILQRNPNTDLTEYKTTSKGFRMDDSKEALDSYKESVFTNSHKVAQVNSIQSRHHRLFTLQQTKIGVNPGFGAKRFALPQIGRAHV